METIKYLMEEIFPVKTKFALKPQPIFLQHSILFQILRMFQLDPL